MPATFADRKAENTSVIDSSVLSGSDLYTGNTSITADTLSIIGGDLGGGNYSATIANSGALLYDTSAAQVLSGLISGSGSLTDTGAGVLTLTASNKYSGGTTVNTGVLIATGTHSLGSNSPLTFANGATFAYEPTGTGSLSLGSGSLTLASGSTIVTALGGTSTITSSGTASLTGNIAVNVWAIPGVSIGAGTDNLITAAAGLGTATGTMSLGNVYNATNFTVGNLTQSATAVKLTVTAATSLTNAYWEGAYSGGANIWGASNGLATGGSGNWTTN